MANPKPQGCDKFPTKKHQDACSIVLDHNTSATDNTANHHGLFPTIGIGQEACDDCSTEHLNRQCTIENLLIPSAQNPSSIDLVSESYHLYPAIYFPVFCQGGGGTLKCRVPYPITPHILSKTDDGWTDGHLGSQGTYNQKVERAKAFLGDSSAFEKATISRQRITNNRLS